MEIKELALFTKNMNNFEKTRNRSYQVGLDTENKQTSDYLGKDIVFHFINHSINSLIKYSSAADKSAKLFSLRRL